MYIMANIIHLQALIFPLKVIQNIETKAALLEYLKYRYNLGIKNTYYASSLVLLLIILFTMPVYVTRWAKTRRFSKILICHKIVLKHIEQNYGFSIKNLRALYCFDTG